MPRYSDFPIIVRLGFVTMMSLLSVGSSADAQFTHPARSALSCRAPQARRPIS
jgi:hypothetical protein